MNERAQIFLLTYRKYIPPHKLLQLIIRAYNAYVDKIDPGFEAALKVKRLRY